MRLPLLMYFIFSTSGFLFFSGPVRALLTVQRIQEEVSKFQYSDPDVKKPQFPAVPGTAAENQKRVRLNVCREPPSADRRW